MTQTFEHGYLAGWIVIVEVVVDRENNDDVSMAWKVTADVSLHLWCELTEVQGWCMCVGQGCVRDRNTTFHQDWNGVFGEMLASAVRG